MVQRLSLFGLVSNEEVSMTLTTLESISGMVPRTMREHQEIWEPRFRFNPQPVAGQVNKIEQYRLFVHQTSGNSDVIIEAQEVPEAGRNIKVISQTVLRTHVLPGGSEVAPFLTDLGYKHKLSYRTAGFEFVLNAALVLRVFRLQKETGELLDESAQWMVKAYVDVESVTDLQAMEQGTQTLLNIQQELRGIIALKAPSRGSFNARMPRAL